MTQVAKKRRVPSGKLVVKDNKLINSRYNLSVSEVRLFLSMIAQIKRDDKDFKTYRIQISEFADALGTSSKNIYDRAKDTSKRLMEQVMVIEEEDGPLQVALISSAKYYEGKGYMDLRFDPSLKPYLLQLKEKFTA
ncbi:MAG: replication initiation protein, partial [Bacteroidota bacterium]